jgi:hypothetical protein
VHGHIDAPVRESLLQFLCKQALAPRRQTPEIEVELPKISTFTSSPGTTRSKAAFVSSVCAKARADPRVPKITWFIIKSVSAASGKGFRKTHQGSKEKWVERQPVRRVF